MLKASNPQEGMGSSSFSLSVASNAPTDTNHLLRLALMTVWVFPEHTIANFQSLQTSQQNAVGYTKPGTRRIEVQRSLLYFLR